MGSWKLQYISTIIKASEVRMTMATTMSAVEEAARKPKAIGPQKILPS